MNRPNLPADKVSRNPKARTACQGEVLIAMISQEGDRVSISCGWSQRHPRRKVREDRAEKHVNEHHGGQAMWL